MLSVLKEGGINVHGPAFDFLLRGLNPADFFGTSVLLFITKGEPGGRDEDEKRSKELEESQGARRRDYRFQRHGMIVGLVSLRCHASRYCTSSRKPFD
jgi:hypothetical protein